MRVLVKDVMTRTVIRLQKDWTIKKVVQLFLDRVIDGAPVINEKGMVIGIFTKTHLLRAFDMPLDTRIEDLMTKNVIPINENMLVEEALSIPVGRLPVVNEEGLMVGWLTRTDLANAFLDQYQSAIGGLESILDSLPDPVISIDRLGVISFFNQVAAELYGLERDEVIGSKINIEIKDYWGLLEVARTGQTRLGIDSAVKGVRFRVDVIPVMRQENLMGAMAILRQV
ncbi:MAG: CBS domain-containing protein [Clostridia bacterium]|nr:CBS domain-containing protein [Clostridia bacterium]